MHWSCDFAPRNWHFCDGSLVLIPQYRNLYSLLLTTYGGDGRTTFALPDLRGRIPIGSGPAFGQTYTLGKSGGRETVTLTIDQMAQHAHSLTCDLTASVAAQATGTNAGPDPGPGLSFCQAQGVPGVTPEIYNDSVVSLTNVAGVSLTGNITLGTTGQGVPEPLDIRPAFQAVNYIICVDGSYPPRGVVSPT